MADLANISQIASFIPDADLTSVAQRWKRWSDRFDNLIIALNVTDNARKNALLLHLAGEVVFEIFDGLVLPAIPDDADAAVTNVYTAAKGALDAHFNPKRNVEFERYTFRSEKQKDNETIDAYHSRLRNLSRNCEFANVDIEIKSHIIQTCLSTRLRRRALVETTLSLQALLDLGRSMETTEKQVKVIESATGNAATGRESVAYVRRQPRGGNWSRPPACRYPVTLCRNCSKPFPHPGGKESCPAFSSICRGCQKRGHWLICCRSSGRGGHVQAAQNQHPPEIARTPTTYSQFRGRGRGLRRPQHVRFVDDQPLPSADEESEDETFVFSVGTTPGLKQPRTNVNIQGTLINLILDSGSSVNIIDEKQWSSMKNKPPLKPAKLRIYAYDSKIPISLI